MTLNWHNEKSYDHDTLAERIKFVESNMHSLLPLHHKEKDILDSYAQEHNLPPDAMYSLRNTVKIQAEINASKYFASAAYKIKNKFIKNINELIDNNSNLKFFLTSTRMPVGYVIKLIEMLPEYKQLSDTNLIFLKKIKESKYLMDQTIRQNAIDFENSLGNYLVNANIKFKTEETLSSEGSTYTPDILFDSPVTLNVGGDTYQIKWMDAKNYALVDMPFIIKSLNKQAGKYHDAYGLGAFVFHYGFDASINIPGAVILDGSFLDKKN